jgi:PAS domain S-box-containing protein
MNSPVECDNKHNILLESGLVAYLALGLDGIIADCNETFSVQMGFDATSLIGNDIDLILHPEFINELHQILQQNNIAGKFITFNCTFRPSTGGKVHAMLKGMSFLCSKSNQIKFYFVFSDITEKVAALEKISSQLSHMKLKDELIQIKDIELKKQNAELSKLNRQLKEQSLNAELLNSRIIEHEMHTRQALSAVNDGVWEWDSDSNKFYFSDKFFTMLGYDTFEFAHTLESWLKLAHPDDKKIVKNNIEQLLVDITFELSVEYRMRKKNGDYSWVLSRGAVTANQNASTYRILGTNVDIDQRKRIELALLHNEEELKKQNIEYHKINLRLEKSNRKTQNLIKQLQDKQAHLNSILASVPAAIGMISNKIIIFANDYACLMTGYSIDELCGHDASFLYPTNEEYEKTVAAIRHENELVQTKSINTVWKMKNGTLLDVYLTASHIGSDVLPDTYTISAIDVTSQRLYEDQLLAAKEEAERAEKLKTSFLCNISHELRTPANGIIGFAEMLQVQSNPVKRDQYLKIIINSSKQLIKIISDIIDISKIETGDIEIFNVKVNMEVLLNEYFATYRTLLNNRNKSHIELINTSNLDAKNKVVQIDENKLRQILNSLIGNAVKFTDTGKIEFGCTIENEKIKFHITDTGIGIDSSEYEMIFECFRQTETPTRKLYGGNGLGLAIAKGFTSALGGNIWVESVKDVGSTFFVELPYTPSIEENISVEDFHLKNWKDFHILVVEDDVTSMSLIDALLDDTSIKISHAITGLEAVKTIKKDQSINIVLMDMRLPELDGYEATKRIKEIRPNIVIIAQTAHALTEDRTRCITAGCDEYLTKPIEQNLLFEFIEKLLIEKN